MLQGPSLFTRISYTTLTIPHSFTRVSLIFCISKHKFTTRRHDSKVRKTTSEFFRVFLPPNYRPNFNMDVNYDSQILFRSEYQARKCRKNILIRQAKYRSWHRQFSSGRKKKGGGKEGGGNFQRCFVHCWKSTISSTESAYGPPLKASPLRTACTAC